MTEKLAEVQIRDRYVITLPLIIRDILNFNIDDFVRFERNDTGDICICKSVTHKVNNNICGGDEKDEGECKAE